MAYFSEIEKLLICKINTFPIDAPVVFGYYIRDLLFKKDSCAVFISEEPETCQLLALNSNCNLIRAKIIDLISLITFLEINHFVIIIDGPPCKNWLFYQDANEMFEVDTDPSKYPLPLGVNSEFEIKTKVTNGYIQNIQAQINLSNSKQLTAINYGHNINKSLARILTSYIYPTSKLTRLVSNKFFTDEEIYNKTVLDKADTQIGKANWSILIALFSLSVSLISFFTNLIPNIYMVIIPFYKILNLL